MKEFIEECRKLGSFAHVDAGKTTTLERILKITGKPDAKLLAITEGETTCSTMDDTYPLTYISQTRYHLFGPRIDRTGQDTTVHSLPNP